MSTLDLGKIKQLWRGTWSGSASYLPNDIVAYNGAVWICTQGHTVGASTEFSPGKRDRTNLLPKTVDPAEIITFNVTVATVNSVNYFFIDGRQTPTLTLNANVHYKFYQKDASNVSHRFALSLTPDGIFGTNGAEFVNSNTTYTYQYSGTPGVDGTLDVILSSTQVGAVYYFSANDVGFGGVSLNPRPQLTVAPGWRGYQYWDQLTTGLTFIGAWNSSTQYYYNNVVEYQGATYLALADNINSFPSEPIGNHNWMLLANGDRRSEHNSAGWFMNKGPIGWPYPHGNQGSANHHQAIKWISRSGRVYNHGAGYNYNHGVSQTQAQVDFTYPQEITFNHADWWASRDNGGTGRLVTPDGMPPRCIQIEAGYNSAHYLFNNGEVWGNGNNSQGYLGTGDATASGLPKRVIGLNDVKIVKISAGYGHLSDAHHVLALDDQGFVWVWGANNVGQLGLGTTTDMYTAQRLPRTYFNNERVVDVLAIGTAAAGVSYVRTAQGNLYAWGANGASQLGTGDTATRYRPVQMSSSTWVPSANNGIQKWQVANVGSNAMFMLLDGNGFLWQTGADTYGAAAFAAATGRTTLTKSTAGPAGSITNFWLLWCGDNSAFVQNFIRITTGATYSCGIGATATSGNNTMGYGSTQFAAATAANLITAGTNPLSTTLGSGSQGLVNLVDVYLHVSYSGTYKTITWLTQSGKMFSQGYNNFGENGNPSIPTASNNPVDETGTTYNPVHVYTFPGTKTVQIMAGGSAVDNGTLTTIDRQHGMFAMTDIGQVYAWGMSTSNNTSPGYQGSFVGYSPAINANAGSFTPVVIQYAR